MGLRACSYKSLRINRPLPTGFGCRTRLPGGVHWIQSRQRRQSSRNKIVSSFRADPELTTIKKDGARLIFQASLLAIGMAIPFAAPSKAWAGKKAPKEEPVAVVVEEEPAYIRQAKECAKQAEEFANQAKEKASSVLLEAQATTASAVEYVKVEGEVALSRAQALKEQLVAEYGNPAALQKTEVQVAGAVVSLVVLIVLFKAISSVFSSSPDQSTSSPNQSLPAAKDDSVSSDPPALPPANTTATVEVPATEAAVIAEVPVTAAAVTAAAAASRREPLNAESASAIATQIREIFREDPAKFALMVEWLRSPAANNIRPQLVEEMTRISALATSSQDEDDLPPSLPPTTSTSTATTASSSGSSNGVVKPSSNGVVSAKRRIPRQVDPRQLVTLVEWLRSPGAAPIRDKLGQDVADKVAVWASARAGITLEPLPIVPSAAPPSSSELNGAVAKASIPTASEASTPSSEIETPTSVPPVADAPAETPGVAPPAEELIALIEPLIADASSEATLAETTTSSEAAIAETTTSFEATIAETTTSFEATIAETTTPSEATIADTATSSESTPAESAAAESLSEAPVAETNPGALVIEAAAVKAPEEPPAQVTEAETLSAESILVLETSQPERPAPVSGNSEAAPVAAASQPATEEKQAEEPLKPKTVGDVLSKKGAATPALLALGLGALAFDAMLGLGESVAKSTTRSIVKTATPGASAPVIEKKPAAIEKKPAVIEKEPAQTQPEARATPIGPPVELEAVTFSFDEEPASKAVSKSS